VHGAGSPSSSRTRSGGPGAILEATSRYFRALYHFEIAIALAYQANVFYCKITGEKMYRALRVTPAMEAGVSDHVWSLEEIAALADSRSIQLANWHRPGYETALQSPAQ
jgi:hypothetical protein